jgi:ribose transport system substrate-binding protein
MKSILKYTTAVAALAMSAQFAIAGPETVSGPGADPDCFAPVSSDTAYFKWAPREGPYKVALVNGFIANDWRVQMIAVAKAYAEQAEVAAELEEFKVKALCRWFR